MRIRARNPKNYTLHFFILLFVCNLNNYKKSCGSGPAGFLYLDNDDPIIWSVPVQQKRQQLQSLLPSGCYPYRGIPSFLRGQVRKMNRRTVRPSASVRVYRSCRRKQGLQPYCRDAGYGPYLRLMLLKNRVYRPVHVLFVSSGNGVLETGRVGRVTGDGNIYVFFPHDSDAFAYIVGSVAVYFCPGAVGVSFWFLTTFSSPV